MILKCALKPAYKNYMYTIIINTHYFYIYIYIYIYTITLHVGKLSLVGVINICMYFSDMWKANMCRLFTTTMSKTVHIALCEQL